MTSFFPDINVWTALSVSNHAHSSDAWRWLSLLDEDVTLIFCRFTQLGLLRLLTNRAVMGAHPLTLKQAIAVYDRWAEDRRVQFYPEPGDLDGELRTALSPSITQPAAHWIGDAYLLAYAARVGARLVTFDQALCDTAAKLQYAPVLLKSE